MAAAPRSAVAGVRIMRAAIMTSDVLSDMSL
jgi:hypothetical protein